MTLEPLEPRDCPTLDLGAGLVGFDSGAAASAFGPTWTGPLNIATDPATGDVYVGPDAGGGPNLAHFDRLGRRVENDRYVGTDPGSREGLVPVIVGGNVATPPAPMSFGPAGGYPVFLDGASNETTAETAAYFAGIDDVRVTNERPDLPPGDYATVLFVGRVPMIPGGTEGALGYADVGAVTRPHGALQGPTALVGPPEGSEVAAHEIGHLFGLVHVTGRPDVMNPILTPGARFSAAEVVTIHDAAETGGGKP